MVSELMDHLGQKVRMMGHLVNYKNVRTQRKELMRFGTFIDAEGRFFDSVHFPNSLKNYPFRGYGIYLILAKVVVEFGFPSLEVEKMAPLAIQEDPRG